MWCRRKQTGVPRFNIVKIQLSSAYMSSLFRSTISVLSGKIAVTAIGFIFTPILVRLISQEQYGIYATVLAGFSIIALITKGGIFDATRKIVAETQSKTEQSGITSTAIILSLTYACLSILMIWVIFQTGIIPGQYATYVPVLAIGLVFINLLAVTQGAFHGRHTEYISEILNIFQKGSFVFLALVFLILGGELFGVFLGYSISFAIATVIGLYILKKEFQLAIPGKKAFRKPGVELFGYGTTQLVGGLSALLLYKTDILLVEYFRSSYDTALYKAALLPAEYVWLVPVVIQIVFLQRAADLWSRDDIQGINDQLATGVKYAILSLSLFGIGLFPLAAVFLGVYFGDQYAQGYLALQILLLGTILFGIGRVIIPVFQATGWIQYTETMTFVTLILNVVLNIWLIPQYGIIGAAIGTATSYSFMLVWAVILWKHSVFRFPDPILLSKWIIPQIGYGIIYVPIVYFINIGYYMNLIIFPILGLTIFIILNHFFDVFNIIKISNLVLVKIN